MALPNEDGTQIVNLPFGQIEPGNFKREDSLKFALEYLDGDEVTPERVVEIAGVFFEYITK